MSWITNILDDDLFVCTAEDGQTYNVKGREFKSLVSASPGNMPWDCWDRGSILHILNIRGTTSDLQVNWCHAFTYPAGEYLGYVRDIPSETGEEFILLVHGKRLNSFFAYNYSGLDWDFGPLTDTSKVENFSMMFSYSYDFTSETVTQYFSLCNANNTYDMITSASSGWTSPDLNLLNVPMFNNESSDASDWYTWQDPTIPILGSVPVYGSITSCNDLKPWERDVAKGRIFHLINRSGTTNVRHAHQARAIVYDMNGIPLPSPTNGSTSTIQIPDDGIDYVVIITGSDDMAKKLFANSSGDWDFGPLTDTSGISNFESMFDYCMGLTTTTIAETFNFNNATNVKYMLSAWNGGALEVNLDQIYMPLLPSEDADGTQGWKNYSGSPKWGKGEPGKPAWETWKQCDPTSSHAILHLKITDDGQMYFQQANGSDNYVHILDMDGNLVAYDTVVRGNVGDELVVLWNTKELKNSVAGSTCDWDFGPLTDTSNVSNFESMFDYCMSFSSDSVAETFDFRIANNIKNMFDYSNAANSTNFGIMYAPGIPSITDENAYGWDAYGSHPKFGEYPPCP